jgi:hypothetical protein
MTTATRLSIYNGACSVIGERQLQSLTEVRESRRALDDIWDRGGLNTCLSNGLWNFAARGIQWNYDSSYTPPFGYQCVFELPADWVRWMMVSTDPYFSQPLLQYTGEGQFFYCDLQQLYVKYVSNDPNFGMNFAGWPDNFQRYVEAYFGTEICMRVTGDTAKRDAAEKERDKRLNKAKSTDAMNEATALLPVGNWRQARHGRRSSIERGNPYSLYG